MSDYTRISITIPKDTNAALTRISSQLGLSKSSCLSRLVAPALHDLDKLFSEMDTNVSALGLQESHNEIVLTRLKAFMRSIEE